MFEINSKLLHSYIKKNTKATYQVLQNKHYTFPTTAQKQNLTQPRTMCQDQITRYECGCNAPRITPQSVCPQTMTSGTRSTPTANSTVADTPPIASGNGGTMLPMTRQMNSSPGLVWVSRQGSIRESEQVTNSASGRCPEARLSKRSWCSGST